MLNKNSILLGIALGIIIPFVGLAILLEIYDRFAIESHQRTISLLAICLNLIPFQYYNRQKMVNSMRGVILVTIILAVVWIIYHGRTILS